MRCLKPFGERVASRDPGRQSAGIQIRIALINRLLINRFNAPGTNEIVRVA
ncbi:transposase IS4 family protein [Citreicella sp. SE45]|nr:transposase IS4 family protein [Citreicella sp. SE45]